MRYALYGARRSLFLEDYEQLEHKTSSSERKVWHLEISGSRPSLTESRSSVSFLDLVEI